mgnify:CR=1 FL=1|tara:strand:+ start:2368 stop:3798 length:1431 start_codon:yes stop_codon:yes gene_type:complete
MAQLPKDQIQFAGEFLLEDCIIVSTTGAKYNIVELVQEINIYENLYQASISGDIVIKDTNNIVDNFPIIGEERLLLKIITPQKSPRKDTTIDFTFSPLMIYKINTVQGDGENALIVSLQFGSIEAFRNNTCRVSQSYSGQPSDIVEKILRDETYLRSKKPLYIEPTANLTKIVFPNKRPFRCIEHLGKISNSSHIGNSPSYLFYETTKGIHFRTIDSLCLEETKFYFRETIGGQEDEKGVVRVDNELENIIEYQVVPRKDTIRNVMSGMLSSKLLTHDVYHKKLNLYKYDYLSNFDKDIHPDNGEGKPIYSEAKDPDSQKSLFEHEDTKLFVTTTASGYSFSESSNYPYQSDNLNKTLQRKRARNQQFEYGICMNLEINGQTYIQAGDKINLEIGATSANTDNKLDDTLSGNYIITHLRHTFTMSQELKHKIIMRVAKDSKKGNFYSSKGIQKSDPIGPDRANPERIELDNEYFIL